MDSIALILRIVAVTCIGSIVLIFMLYLGLLILSKLTKSTQGRLRRFVHAAVYFDRMNTHIFYKPRRKGKPSEYEQRDLELKIDNYLRKLKDLDSASWITASDELGSIGPPVIHRLLDIIEKSENPISVRAGIALGKTKNRDIVPDLLKLNNRDSVWVRRGALIALGGIGDSRALDILVDALHDPDPQIQIDAAQALMDLGNPLAIPALAGAMQKSEGKFVFAGVALASFGVAALDQLIEAVKHGYAHELMDEAMKSIGSPAIAPLQELLEDPSVEWFVAPKAASLLGVIGNSSAIPDLEKALYKGDSDLTESAAWALSVINHPAAREALFNALGKDDPMVRGLVAHAIRNIGSEKVVKALGLLLDDDRLVWDLPQMKPVRVSEMAAETLEYIGTEEAMRVLNNHKGERDS